MLGKRVANLSGFAIRCRLCSDEREQPIRDRDGEVGRPSLLRTAQSGNLAFWISPYRDKIWRAFWSCLEGPRTMASARL